jgi:predicted component of viral defense system (DUF524 family)
LLDAESEWIVVGDDLALSEIAKCLPGGIARRIGPALALRFINAVGRLQAGPLGTLVVQSGKWGEREYDRMLEEIGAQASELPFAAGEQMAVPYARDAGPSRVALHALVWLCHATTEPSALLDALRQILREPERRLERDVRMVPTELASSITPAVLEDLCAGRWPLQRVRPGMGANGHLPVMIDDARVRPTLDLPENRFVKLFLEDALNAIAQVRSQLDTTKPLGRQIAAQCHRAEAALAPIRRASMWRDVRVLSQLPFGSTVLQRRAPYREVLRHYLRMHAASRALPLSQEDALQLLAVKDIALLYELWCTFAVLGAARDLLGSPGELRQLEIDPLRARLGWGWLARWAGGIELAVNPTYTRTTGFHGRSMSVELRPDVVLRVPDGPTAGLHIFDAKFRVDRQGDNPGAARVEDLHKMHAYRDAIATVASAWAMYPGDGSHAFGDDGRAWQLDDGARPIAAGIGAIGLLPSSPLRGLRAVLARVLNGR